MCSNGGRIWITTVLIDKKSPTLLCCGRDGFCEEKIGPKACPSYFFIFTRKEYVLQFVL